jgi:hypothetical protein
MKIRILLIALISVHCNNFGLLDKLNDPTSTSSTSTSTKAETFTNNYYVFVTSWTTPGDMSGATQTECAAMTGTNKADCACNIAAINNGLRKSNAHVFRAWLSNTSTNGICRVQAAANGCGTSSPGPWLNTAGQTVATSFAGFASGALTNAIRYDETGTDSGVNLVWTATLSGGTVAAGQHCGDWLVGSGGSTGLIGDRTLTTATWTQGGTTPTCNTAQRLYCVAAP